MSGISPESGLPQAVRPYVEGARQMTVEQFTQQAPHPFLLFPKSTLWDPLLLKTQASGEHGETKVVSYDIAAGGIPFICPIKKRPKENTDPGVLLGRSSSVNDVVVPVSSVSGTHARFTAPDPNKGQDAWLITDLKSSNGTFVEDMGIDPHKAVQIYNGQPIRLGGNLVAWFFMPDGLYQVLVDDSKLDYYTTY